MKHRFVRIAVAASVVGAVLSATPANAAVPAKGAPQGPVTGTGDGVPGLSPIDEPVIVTMTHDGASNFIVAPVGANGEDGISWANEIGPYAGSIFQAGNSLFSGFSKKNPIVAAEVQADGNWTLQIRKLSSATRLPLGAGASKGDDVIQFSKLPKGFKRITFTHDGTSNFIVEPISAKGVDGVSLVNEIGAYRGTVRLPSGTKYLAVIADGNWSYTVK